MSDHVFDYTSESNKDTLYRYPLQSYRLLHWIEDIISNWLCDAINIKDERLSSLLGIADIREEELSSLCTVGTPYDPDTKRAGSTPKIIVSVGATSYPLDIINQRSTVNALNGNRPFYSSSVYKTTGLNVSVYTESYDGTILLAGLLEDFFVTHETELLHDNMSLSSFYIKGSSAVTEIKQGSAANAKSIYGITIEMTVSGSIKWDSDTQGPVYRGITYN